MSADIDKFCRLIQKHISVVCIGSIDKYNDVDGTFKYRLNTDDQDGDVPSFIEFNTDVHQMASSENDCAMFKASMLIKKNKYIDYTLGNNGLALEDLVLTFVCHTDDWIIGNEYNGKSSVWGVDHLKPLLDNRLITLIYDDKLIELIFNIYNGSLYIEEDLSYIDIEKMVLDHAKESFFEQWTYTLELIMRLRSKDPFDNNLNDDIDKLFLSVLKRDITEEYLEKASTLADVGGTMMPLLMKAMKAEKANRDV
jgi:hypothetical protein